MTALSVPIDLLDKSSCEIHCVELKVGEIVSTTNCSNLLVLEQGCLRVYKRSADGRMFTLYRIHSGECCSLTVSCILNGTKFPAFIEVEDDSKAYIIPAKHVRKFIREDEQWQKYIFEQLTKVVTQLTDLTDNFVFSSMESRIANLLYRRSNERVIYATHQCIANEVGTSREVVSRSLRDLELKGCVRLKRGQVDVIDFSALKKVRCDH
jgi:CRP/FNR family transcriptional regulator